jgi:hypothetical protein
MSLEGYGGKLLMTDTLMIRNRLMDDVVQHIMGNDMKDLVSPRECIGEDLESPRRDTRFFSRSYG